ncbi:MAG TPA: hypothetical protein VFU90_12065, partial [Candidatus Tumulicola sp.]|nr:hypothetical protein [Candidatus Tumulicola sp.]
GGYQGYSAQDSIADGVIIRGQSKVPRRLVFVVNAGTSLPPVALALSAAGEAAIYTTGGSPAILAPSVAEMRLPYGVRVTYRIADLPDFVQPLRFESVNDPQDAVAKLEAEGAPKTSYPRPAAPAQAIAYPYKNATLPPEPLRMLAVAQIYNVIRYFSPYTKLMHDDWDAAALQAIADERTAPDTRAYLLGLMRFYSHLHDSHGFVEGDLMTEEFGAGVPFETRYLHRQVVVTQPPPSASPMKLGDIIDAVNGVPIRRAMDQIERYISSSTPQAADYAALRPSAQPTVFSGRRGTDVSVTFHRAGGRPQTAVFVREPFIPLPDRRGAKYFVLPGNVGYVDFDRLAPSEVSAMFDALRQTRAIVFDNRGYPRGAAWEVAPRLTAARDVRAALFDTPLVTEPLDAVPEEIQPLPSYKEFYQLLPATTQWRYLKPTVMLIDERAISQSEHSALFFRQATQTIFVGTPTRGANGDVTSMLVPGGVSL